MLSITPSAMKAIMYSRNRNAYFYTTSKHYVNSGGIIRNLGWEMNHNALAHHLVVPKAM